MERGIVMKKMVGLMSVAVVCAALAFAAWGDGCTAADATSGATKQSQRTAAVDASASASVKGEAMPNALGKQTDSRVAIVYFSEPEVEDKNTVQGSTEYIGSIIQERTHADVFRIERSDAYPTMHTALVAAAKVEILNGARPSIKKTIGDLSQYDTIFLGYPIWWADMPMPVYTFLDRYDLSGKKLMLFSTHGGSGLAGTVEKIAALEPNATVNTNAFTVYRDNLLQADPVVQEWLTQLGY